MNPRCQSPRVTGNLVFHILFSFFFHARTYRASSTAGDVHRAPFHPPFRLLESVTNLEARIVLYQPKTMKAQLYINRSLGILPAVLHTGVSLLQAIACMPSFFHYLNFIKSSYHLPSIDQRLPKSSLHALSRQVLISFHVTIHTVELSRLVKVTLSSMPASRRLIQPKICARFSTARPLASTW